MNFLSRVWLVLTDPEGATYDLYNTPQIGDAFLIVSTYAILWGINSALSAMMMTDTMSMAFIGFFASALIVYLTWAFLTIAFRVFSAALGGKGELPNTVGFVGLAAAPLILTALLSIFVTLTHMLLFKDDQSEVFTWMRLGLSLIGMVWGWPGILCYFGLKNSERLDSTKALIIVVVMFFVFATIEVFGSGLVSIE